MERSRHERVKYRITAGYIRVGVRLSAVLFLILTGMLVCPSPSAAQIPGAPVVSATLTAGSSPVAMGVNNTTGKLYIANSGDGSVTVVDCATNATATVSVGAGPNAVAVNPVTNQIYVTNGDGNSVTVINGATNATRTISVGTGPNALAVNTVTNKIYVANGSGNSVSVIDGSTNSVTATVAAGKSPNAVDVNPVTNKIYVTNGGSNSVTVIDGSANTPATVAVGSYPVAVAVNPRTNMIYVANYGNPSAKGTVTVIDGVGNATTNISVGSGPLTIAVNQVTNKIYVANSWDNVSYSVSVIYGVSLSTVSIPTFGPPDYLAVDPETNIIYVGGSTIVSRIDGAGDQVLGSLTVSPYAAAIAVNPATQTVYTANANPSQKLGTVSVINVATYVSQGTIASTGKGVTTASLQSMAINGTTHRLYIANSTDGTVTVVDRSGEGATTSTVSVGSSPIAVAVNQSTNKVYVANQGDGTVTIIDGATNATRTVTVSAGNKPHAIAINEKTNMIYVGNINPATGSAAGTVAVLNGATSAITTVGVGVYPDSLAVNSVTNKVYVANRGSSTITVINGATNATSTINVVSPNALAINPIANKIYVTDAGILGKGVTVINGTTDTIEATINLDYLPSAVAVNPLTGLVYVGGPGIQKLTIIDGASDTIAQTLTTSIECSCSIAVDSQRNKIFVTNSVSDGLVLMIDGRRGTTAVTQLAPPNITNAFPQETVVDPSTGSVYVLATYSGVSNLILGFQPIGDVNVQAQTLEDAATALPQTLQPPGGPTWPSPYEGSGYTGITHTVLLIHGRTETANDDSGQYGTFLTDKNQAWAGEFPATGDRYPFDNPGYVSQVLYVVWDAWFRGFDDTTPGKGGYAIINDAMNTYCRLNSFNGTTSSGGCTVICHSAGCAAVENWIAKNNGSAINNPGQSGITPEVTIWMVLAAASAAGGSELANVEASLGIPVGPIDQYLTTDYTKGAYNHNSMAYVPIYAIAGTEQTSNVFLAAAECAVWPKSYYNFWDSYNRDCYACPATIIGIALACNDSAVSLHSSCGHNRPDSFQDCNWNDASGNGDAAGTYESHFYWGPGTTEGYPPNAPYSSDGAQLYNATYHTYRTDHSGAKALAILEYSYCNLAGVTICQ